VTLSRTHPLRRLKPELARQREAFAARRIGVMHQRHGAGPVGLTCRTCTCLVRHKVAGAQKYTHGDLYHKCQHFGVNKSSTTDWRAGWPACGLYHTEETP
jgi:hypothetical protein